MWKCPQLVSLAATAVYEKIKQKTKFDIYLRPVVREANRAVYRIATSQNSPNLSSMKNQIHINISEDGYH